jgi:hypothetical protein
MKKLVIFLFVCFGLLIFASCDPPKGLIIRTNNLTEIIVYTNNKITSIENLQRVIHVPINDTVNFSYGMGAWPKQAIIDLSVNIDSIVFQSVGKKEKLTTQAEIQSYLMKQRKGLFGNFLVIESK